MMALASHLQYVEAEKQKLKAQVRRLCQENAWLRDELACTQQKHQSSEQRVAELEEQIKHLEFMNSMKQFEGDSKEEVKPCDDVKVTQQSLQELGFGPEDEEGDAAHPTPAHSMVASATAGYEIPARLRTLHNLVSSLVLVL